MDFFWVGIIFWGCITASLFLFVFSLMARDVLSMMLSGILLIPPALYSIGSPVLWWIALTPLLLFGLSFYMKRKSAKSS